MKTKVKLYCFGLNIMHSIKDTYIAYKYKVIKVYKYLIKVYL